MAEGESGKGLLRRFLGGLLVGFACLLPGVSGGALAASLGYYEPLIRALGGFFRAPKKNFFYLLPLGVGGVLGVLLAALGLSKWMAAGETQAVSLFLGMVAGSLPSLWRTANPDRPGVRQYAGMLAGAAVILLLFLLEVNAPEAADATVSTWQAVVGGAIIAVGTVIPGVSGSFVLIYLGWYRPLMGGLAMLYMPLVIPTCAGFAVGALALVKVAEWLLTRFRRGMLCLVIGFVTGSMALVFPADFFGERWWLNILLALVGLAIGFAMGKMEKIKEKTQ